MAEYKNPNQHGGKQDTSSLLVFSIVFAAILLGMQFFRPKKPVTPNPAQTAAAKTNASQQNGAGSGNNVCKRHGESRGRGNIGRGNGEGCGRHPEHYDRRE